MPVRRHQQILVIGNSVPNLERTLMNSDDANTGDDNARESDQRQQGLRQRQQGRRQGRRQRAAFLQWLEYFALFTAIDSHVGSG